MNRALLFSLLLTVAASAEEPKLKPCHVPGVDEEVRCGQYDVFENRAARTGRKISLNMVVLPAKGPRVLSDPLVFLAGGGVAPATQYAGFLARAFPTLRRDRDILLVDQRGTGGSNALDCDLSTDATSPVWRDEKRFLAAVRACRVEVSKHADVRDYTTPFAMDDLDEVRAWLGYSKLNLWGASYGTSAAMAYVRQHPDHVRTVALQGVVPLDAPMWLETPRNAQRVLGRVFDACAKNAECHAAFPNFKSEFNALLERLAKKPVHQDNVTIDDVVLRNFAGRMLFGADRIHDLPLLIHLAYGGDYKEIAARMTPAGNDNIPKGIYFSIVCSEQVPLFDARSLDRSADPSFLYTLRARRDNAACTEWTRGWLPPDFHSPVRSNVPVLAMNGELDHLTPPQYGKHVVETLSNARHLVLPYRGHNDVDECTTGIVEAFILAGKLEGLDTRCLGHSQPLTFATKPEQLQR